MNCREFEGRLPDLAGAPSRKESFCAEALRHANVCPRCAIRLADERALAAGLRGLASGARLETAPVYIEEALLTKFCELGRERDELPIPLPEIRSPQPAWWKAPGYVGLAASALLLLGWALLQFTWEAGVDKAQALPAHKPATSSEKKPAALLKVMPEPSSKPVRKPNRPVTTRPPHATTPIAEVQVQYAARPSGRSEHRLREAKSASSDPIETEFLPFMAAGPQFPSEQRQFVRVKLPRSALQVFGLPMNMERAREPVQADGLLGEDGRALAVRFVRD